MGGGGCVCFQGWDVCGGGSGFVGVFVRAECFLVVVEGGGCGGSCILRFGGGGSGGGVEWLGCKKKKSVTIIREENLPKKGPRSKPDKGEKEPSDPRPRLHPRDGKPGHGPRRENLTATKKQGERREKGIQ